MRATRRDFGARETVVEGLEQALAALNMLFDGENLGKLVVQVAEPPVA